MRKRTELESVLIITALGCSGAALRVRQAVTAGVITAAENPGNWIFKGVTICVHIYIYIYTRQAVQEHHMITYGDHDDDK